MNKKRFRIRQEFWLNVSNPNELELAELIDNLKQGRVFSQAIRDGLRLVVDLWSGRVDMLLALFPWIEEYFYNRFLELQPHPEHSIAEQLTRLEKLLIEQGNTPILSLDQPRSANTGGPKPIAVPQVAAPTFDDFEDVKIEVKKAKSDGQSALNFLDSAFNLLG